jgi:hypothetical protein
VNANCTQCHDHNGDNSGTTNGKKHMDGVLWGAGSCNTCHWYDTSDANAWAAVKGSDADLVNTDTAWGAHIQHIDHLKFRTGATLSAGNPNEYGSTAFNLVCGVCHNQTPGTAHKKDGGGVTRTIDFNGSNAHLFGSLTSTPTYSNTTKSCSSVDCHFKPTPAW